jgi:hypothetical protein
MPEVSPDRGDHREAAAGSLTAPRAGGAVTELFGVGARHDCAELGMHCAFLSIADNVI